MSGTTRAQFLSRGAKGGVALLAGIGFIFLALFFARRSGKSTAVTIDPEASVTI